MTTTRFKLGRIVATPNALDRLRPSEIDAALTRHMAGDWGSVDSEDWRANDQALVNGTRLLSAYPSHRGEKFWIITEANRSVTTVLMPEDY